MLVKLYEIFLSCVVRTYELEDLKCVCEKGQHYICLDVGRKLDDRYRLYYLRSIIRSDYCLTCDRLKTNIDYMLSIFRDWLVEVPQYDNQYKGRVLARISRPVQDQLTLEEITRRKFQFMERFRSEIDDRWIRTEWFLTKSMIVARVRTSCNLVNNVLTVYVEGKISRWARTKPEYILAGLKIVKRLAELLEQELTERD